MLFIELFKLLIPVIVTFVKELLVPGTEQQQTTSVSRASLLLNLLLLLLLAFTAQRAFILHGEHIRAETRLETVNILLKEYREQIERDKEIIARLERYCSTDLAPKIEPESPNTVIKLNE